MWKIFRAELIYNKWSLISVFGILFFLGMSSLLQKWGDAYIFAVITMLILFITVGITGAASDKEKRDRFHRLLPVSLKTQIRVRTLWLIWIELGMYLIWIVYFLIEPTDSVIQALLAMFTFGAVFLNALLSFCIFHDLGYFGKIFYRYIFLFLIIVILVIFVFNAGSYSIEISPGSFNSPVKVILLNILMVGMMYMDYIIFIKRKSYLE
jgi:hypothetical protein